MPHRPAQVKCNYGSSDEERPKQVFLDAFSNVIKAVSNGEPLQKPLLNTLLT